MVRPLAAFACLVLAVAGRPASASDWGSLSGTAIVISDYRFRGVSQNDREPTLQGEFDWSGPDDWSAGVFASKVNFADHENTSIEFAFYGNKHVEWHGWKLDVSGNYYAYPNHHPKPGSPRYSSLEFIGDLSRTWRCITLTGTAAWSPNYFGDGSSWYVAGGFSYRITDWLSASATVGEQGERAWDGSTLSGYPYTHWDAGLTATFGALSIDARYITSSLSRSSCLLTQGSERWCSGALVASVSYRFDLAGSEE
jgi:uncharacterized protein (TIGR02001 family)